MKLATILGIVGLLTAIAALALIGTGPRSPGPESTASTDPENTSGRIAPSPGVGDSIPAPLFVASDELELSPELEEFRRQLLEIMRQPIDGEDLSEKMLVMQARRDALEDLLAQLGPDAVELLVELLLEEPDFIDRRQLMMALGEIGSDPAANALVDHYWRLFDQENESELNYSIEALGLVQSTHSFDLLTDMIGIEKAAPHRFRFVEQLGRHQDNGRAVPTFLRVAEEDTYFKTRSRAALALKWAGDPASVPQVERLLESEEDKFVRQALCGTLGDLGDPTSVSKLGSIARSDENHQTRMSAIRAMSRIGTSEARRIIEECAGADEHERVRIEAERALRRLDQDG